MALSRLRWRVAAMKPHRHRDVPKGTPPGLFEPQGSSLVFNELHRNPGIWPKDMMQRLAARIMIDDALRSRERKRLRDKAKRAQRRLLARYSLDHTGGNA